MDLREQMQALRLQWRASVDAEDEA
jgi:hypothetical protein